MKAKAGRKEEESAVGSMATYEMDTTKNELHIRILAASAATREEIEKAKNKIQ